MCDYLKSYKTLLEDMKEREEGFSHAGLEEAAML